MQHISNLAVLVNTNPIEPKTIQQYVAEYPDALPLAIEQLCMVLNSLNNTVAANNEKLEKLTEKVAESEFMAKRRTLTKDDVSNYLINHQRLLHELYFEDTIKVRATTKELNEDSEDTLDMLIGLEISVKSEPQFFNSILTRPTLLTGIKQTFQYLGYQERLKKSDNKKLLESIIIQFTHQSTTKPRKNIPVKYLMSHSGLSRADVYSYTEELGYEKIELSRTAHICKSS